MTRSLLVVAASTYQLPVILKARALGLRVITADNRPSNPGHAVADASFDIDIRDREAILRLARSEGVIGVVSPCSDIGTLTAAYVTSSLGLPGPPYESCRILTNKALFRGYITNEGLPCPPFVLVAANSGAPMLEGDGLWVLKPADSSGSKGVRIVASREELDAALPECLEHSESKQAVLEEYLDGHQATCEGVLEGGQIRFMVVIDRLVAPLPYVATAGHIIPSALDDSTISRLKEQLEHLWSRLGITDAVFDCDFVVHGGEIFILEMSPRLGGNSIESLVKSSCGLDLGDRALRLACGFETSPLPDVEGTPACNLILGVTGAGALEYDEEGFRSLKAEPWVIDLTLDYVRGSSVLPFINGQRRVGRALLQGMTRDDLLRKRTELHERLNLRAVEVPK